MEYEKLKNRIDDYLTYLSLCNTKREEDKKYSSYVFHDFNPNTLTRLEPLIDTDVGGEDQRMFLNPNGFDISALDNGIDQGEIILPQEDDKSEFKYVAVHLKKVSDLKEARGKVGKLFPNLHVFKRAFLCHDGKYTTNTHFCIPTKDFSWKFLTCQHEYRDTRNPFHKKLVDVNGKDLATVLNMIASTQLTQRYEWGVEIGNGYGPSINITVPPRSISEIFKLRDVPDGKKRRSQLRNWVNEYWRQRPENGESVYVRKHLRGSMSFTIENWHCTVRPSAFDLDVNERLKGVSS